MAYFVKKLLPLLLPAFSSAQLIQPLPLPLGATPAPVGDFNLNALYSQYATAAYCPQNTLGGLGDKVNCPNGQCNDAQNATIVAKFDLTSTNTGGFVAVDQGQKLVVVAVRGAENFAQLLNLLTTSLTQADASQFCSGCLVSGRFLQGYLQVNQTIIPAVVNATQQNLGFKVVTVGHSYGGAISHLAALDIRKLTPSLQVDLATYGSPRVGNPAFANFLDGQNNQNRTNGTPFGRNIRVVHNGDVVVNIPPPTTRPLIIIGPTTSYQHTTPFLILNNLSGTPPRPIELFTVPAPDVNIAVGTLVEQAQAHRWYFNGISFCETLPPPGTFPLPNIPFVAGTENDDIKKDAEALEQFYKDNNMTIPDVGI